MVDTYNDTLVKTFRMHLKSLNSNKLWTSVNNDVSILVHQNANIEAQGLGYMWMVGEAVYFGERETGIWELPVPPAQFCRRT